MGTGNGRGLKSHLDDGGKTRVYGWIRKLLPGLNKVVSRDQKDGKRQGLFVRSLNPSRPEFSLDPFLSLSGSFHWLNYYLFTKLFVHISLVPYACIQTHNTPSTESVFSF